MQVMELNGEPWAITSRGNHLPSSSWRGDASSPLEKPKQAFSQRTAKRSMGVTTSCLPSLAALQRCGATEQQARARPHTHS